MKREIKFRVWDNVDYMSSPFTLSDLQSKQIQFTSDCEVMQFTGLKDRNGKEVYDGDILSDGEEEPMMLPVIYSDEFAMFCVDISYNKDGGSIEEILTCYEGGFTVVGNIHESPELLNN